MAELDERLKGLDGDSLKKVLEAAGALLSKEEPTRAVDTQASEPVPGSPDQNQRTAPEQTVLPALLPGGAGESTGSEAPAGLNQLLDALLGSSSQSSSGRTAEPPQASAGGASALTSALPQLLQAFSGKSNYIDENRLNLIKAIKPYMAETRAGSVDRAIKMANMAKAAKMALGLLGR